MHKVPVVSLVSLKKKHPEVVGSLQPVDSGKYANSGAGNYIEVPDDVAGVYFSRGRDTTGNYYRFWYLPTAPSPLPTVPATALLDWVRVSPPFDLTKIEYRTKTLDEMANSKTLVVATDKVQQRVHIAANYSMIGVQDCVLANAWLGAPIYGIGHYNAKDDTVAVQLHKNMSPIVLPLDALMQRPLQVTDWAYAPEEYPDEFDFSKYDYRVITQHELGSMFLYKGTMCGSDAINHMGTSTPWWGLDPNDNTFCLALRPGNRRHYMQWVHQPVFGLMLTDCRTQGEAESKIMDSAGYGSVPIGAYMRKVKP